MITNSFIAFPIIGIFSLTRIIPSKKYELIRYWLLYIWIYWTTYTQTKKTSVLRTVSLNIDTLILLGYKNMNFISEMRIWESENTLSHLLWLFDEKPFPAMNFHRSGNRWNYLGIKSDIIVDAPIWIFMPAYQPKWIFTSMRSLDEFFFKQDLFNEYFSTFSKRYFIRANC